MVLMTRRPVLSPLRNALAALGALVLLVTATPLVEWWAHRLSGRLVPARGEVLIVLSSSGLQDGIPDSTSYWRAVYAIRAWRGGGFQTVLVSGGPPADAIRDVLVAAGVPRSAVVVEDHSHSTRENALFTKPYLESLPGRKVLLTSDYHMLRARLAFAKAGIAVLPMPIPDVRKRAVHFPERWDAFLDLCVETAKLAGYRLRGWL
jgi:uncharacterized SAM-binding protein YcdF (DUF218 family)